MKKYSDATKVDKRSVGKTTQVGYNISSDDLGLVVQW